MLYFFSLESSIEGLRNRPTSYCNQVYYSPVTYDFNAEDSVKRCCRFRVVPAKNEPESGRLSREEQNNVWYSM